MSKTTKEEFLIATLKKFSLYVGENLGKENQVYIDIQAYSNNLTLFIQDLIRLSATANTREGKKEFEIEDINKYLIYKNITTKVNEDICNKLMQYLNAFLDVLNC